jgi:hypothetical protein
MLSATDDQRYSFRTIVMIVADIADELVMGQVCPAFALG